jgi:hypothetical protein
MLDDILPAENQAESEPPATTPAPTPTPAAAPTPAPPAAPAANPDAPAEPPTPTEPPPMSPADPGSAVPAAPAPTPEIEAAGFGAMLKGSLKMYGKLWWQVLLLAGITTGASFLIATWVVSLLMTNLVLAIAMVILLSLVPTWVTLALAHLVIRQESGLSFGAALGLAAKRLFPFLWISFLASLVVLGGQLLIIPGIIWSISFVVLMWVFVDKEIGGLKGLIYCRQLVKGSGWWVFGSLLIFGILYGIYSVLVTFIGGIADSIFGSTATVSTGALTYALAPAGPTAADYVEAVLNGLIAFPISFFFLYQIYADLKRRKENALPELPKQRRYFIIAAIAGPIAAGALFALVFGSFIMMMLQMPSPSRMPLPSYQAELDLDNVDLESPTVDPTVDLTNTREDEPGAPTENPEPAAAEPQAHADPNKPAEWTGGDNDDDDEDGYINGNDLYRGPGVFLPADPLFGLDPTADEDSDGRSNAEERFSPLPSDPFDPDTDADGIADNDEFLFLTSPTKADTDGDGYSDSAELIAGYTPNGFDEGTDIYMESIVEKLKTADVHDLTRQTLKGHFGL